MNRITVGDGKGNRRLWRYSDIPVNPKGWVINPDYKPYPFDIVHLLIRDRDKSINGWWTGIKWEGLRLKRSYEVIGWKINKEFL